MSGVSQDLQRLLVSFLPCPGARCHPGPLSVSLAWPLGLGWEHTLGTSVLVWLFQTAPGFWHSTWGFWRWHHLCFSPQ